METKEKNLYRYLKKSLAYKYECSACGEKISYKLSFDLIEENLSIKEGYNEKKPKQYIFIVAKPLVDKNYYLDRDSYIYGIKKSFTYNTYKEKFNYIDFKDSCNLYSNIEDYNLLNIYNDLIKSVKENKSRIKINKFHLIFSYYLSGTSIWDNLIILTLDNEKEYSILECYEEANKKAYKLKHFNEKNQDFKNLYHSINNKNEKYSPNLRTPSKTDIKIYNSKRKSYLINNNKNFNEVNFNSDLNFYSNDNNMINESYNDDLINFNYDSNFKNMSNKNYNLFNSNCNEKYGQEIHRLNNNGEKININNYNYNKTKVNKCNSSSNSKKKSKNVEKKHKKNHQMLTSLLENEHEKEKNKKIRGEKSNEKNKIINDENEVFSQINLSKIKSPTKYEKEIITKKFLYGEYNFSGTQSEDEYKNIEKSKENKKEEDSECCSSLFDEDEVEEGNFISNEIRNDNINEENILKNESLYKRNNIENIDYKKFQNDHNFLGHKFNRIQDGRIEKDKNRNNQKEKKDNNNIIKNRHIIERKDYLNNTQVIAISESEDDLNKSKNKSISKIKKKSKVLDKQLNKRNNSGQIGCYDQSSNSQFDKSAQNNKINSNQNNNMNTYPPLLLSPHFNNKLKEYTSNNSLLLKFMSEPSNVIRNVSEIKLIKDKIEKCKELYFKLVYNSIKDKDDYSTFKNSIIDYNRHLILVKTTHEKRFGIYFYEKLFSSKGRSNQEIIDMRGFIFSFDKYSFYEPAEGLICFTQSPQLPYLFKLSDYSIYIKNNFMSCTHHLSQTSRVFNIKNLYNELNGGEKEYNIDVLEIYRAEIQNK